MSLLPCCLTVVQSLLKLLMKSVMMIIPPASLPYSVHALIVTH